MGFLDKLNRLVKSGTKKDGTKAPPADVLGPRILHSVDNPTVEFAASLSLLTTEGR